MSDEGTIEMKNTKSTGYTGGSSVSSLHTEESNTNAATANAATSNAVNNNDIPDLNENESINSFDSYTQQPQQYVPQQLVGDDSEQNADGTTASRRTVSNASLRLVPTETAKSLNNLGLSANVSANMTNAPLLPESGNKPLIFPEEYTLETETGLVPVTTLQSIGRGRAATGGSGFLSRVGTAAGSETSGALHRRDTRGALTRTSTWVSQLIPEDEATMEEKLEEEEEKQQQQQQGAGVSGPLDHLDPEIEFVTFTLNDPENPHNWSLKIRWLYTILFSILVVSVAYGSACISGGLGTVMDKFHVSEEVAILSVSLMVFGFALGPLLWSPVSDIYGRRVAYFVSMGLYVIFNIPCALAPNIGCLLAVRFLCGVWSSSALCLVGGSISDLFDADNRGKAIAFFAFAPYCGPVFGPLVNGFIAVSTDRMDLIFWVNMAIAGAMWLIVALIPETYQPVILKKKAAKLRKETGNPKIMTEQEAQGLTFKEMMVACVVRPLYFAVTEPVLDMMCFYVCLIYSLLYAFFFAYPVIFGELYGYKDNLIGLMFIPILMGAIGALFTTYYCELQYLKITRSTRAPTPEDRLLGAMIGAPFAAIALWILGATSSKGIIWVGPASAGIAFGYGMVLIYYSLNNYIIDCYAQYASSALATKVFLRSAGGGVFPLFTTAMYHRLGLHWASYLLAFISTAMIALPFGFYVYGKQLRAKLSKKDYSLQDL
ncbi:spermine transporter [Hanseniaspora vineae]